MADILYSVYDTCFPLVKKEPDALDIFAGLLNLFQFDFMQGSWHTMVF